MFYSTLLLAATALTGLVSAQNYSTTSGALTIDPNSVDYDTRLSWCRAQTNSCPQLCGGQAFPNSCDPNTLNYTCTCTDGSSPNISSYDQTIPSFVCAAWKTDCVAAHPDDLSGQTACLAVTCGMKNASSGEMDGSSSTSSMMSMTATSTGSGGMASSTGGSDSSASSTTSGGASAASSTDSAAVLNVAMTYGTGILATGMLALFGLAL